jgi:glucose-1-phosphate thymidylyltransferase
MKMHNIPQSKLGIVLAGGRGTRLFPATSIINKQALPIYDKPMIYYPITTLMLAGIRDILLVSSEEHISTFKSLLGNGEKWGLAINYFVQSSPNGIPEIFRLLPDEMQRDENVLILGDNLLYGVGLGESLKEVFKGDGALSFAYSVSNPEDYGVVVMGENRKAALIVEKPNNFVSNLAIPGLYFFDKTVFVKSKKLSKSPRGEFEIVDLLNMYLNEGSLEINLLERGTAWLDTGSQSSMLDASEFVRVIEKRQGLKIGCPEEVSLRMGYVSYSDFMKNVRSMPECDYKNYLANLSL